MSAQVTATAPPLSNDLANYNNRWDAYGGFGYARFQTTLGVNLKTNMYGWKGQVTGWLNPIVGSRPRPAITTARYRCRPTNTI